MDKPNDRGSSTVKAGGDSNHHVEFEVSSSELHGRAIQQQEYNRGYLETLRKDLWLLFWIGIML